MTLLTLLYDRGARPRMPSNQLSVVTLTFRPGFPFSQLLEKCANQGSSSARRSATRFLTIPTTELPWWTRLCTHLIKSSPICEDGGGGVSALPPGLIQVIIRHEAVVGKRLKILNKQRALLTKEYPSFNMKGRVHDIFFQ